MVSRGVKTRHVGPDALIGPHRKALWNDGPMRASGPTKKRRYYVFANISFSALTNASICAGVPTVMRR